MERWLSRNFFKQTAIASRMIASSLTRAPAREIDWEALSRTVEASIIESLQSDDEFCSSPDLRSQCIHACRILRDNRRPSAPYSLIGRILDANKGTVKRHYKQFMRRPDGPRSNGRPPVLTPEQQTQVVEMISDAYRRRSPCTLSELKDYITKNFHVALEKSTLCHMIERDPRMKTCRGVPMEAKRIEVTPEQISEFFADAFRIIQGVPAHFVFNMDEMGHQEWADREDITCVVPLEHADDYVNVPVPRTGKRITLVSCIALDGSFLKPTVIIPRKTVDNDLPLTGMTSEKVTVKSQVHGFVTGFIFDSWVEETFIQEVSRRRQQFDYDGPAVLLLDNCTCHQSDRFAELCGRERIIPVYFPPHSSNQLQPLDLSLFGVTKRLMARVNRLDAVNIQSKHIAQVVSSFMSAASPLNIVKTFSLSGIGLIVDDEGILRCLIQPEKAQRLLTPLIVTIPDPGTTADDTSDDEEIRAFAEEIADLLYEHEHE